MKGDISRNTFDPLKRFRKVLLQQGRVQLDANWNEQMEILMRCLQTLTADLIGPFGGAGEDSFKIDTYKVGNADQAYDFLIKPGHYYVNGILCEIDSDEVVTYSNQLGYPLSDTANLKEGWHLVYLDVWERHVTYIEDDSIREVALGGPDTATRTQIVWQAKVEGVKADTNCLESDEWARLVDKWQPPNRGQLKAQAKLANDTASTDPCIIPPLAQYRGPENQLYRVEIHQGGQITTDPQKPQPTFKWSRNNASEAIPVETLNGKIVTLEHLGLDARSSLQEEDWVEIVDDTYVLQGRVEPLLKVVNINRATMQVTLEKAPVSNVGEDPTKHPLLRRWDHKKDANNSTGTKPDDKGLADEKGVIIVEGNGINDWLHLEDGVHIQFQPGATYRSGDYWLIPARTVTRDIECRKDAKGLPQPMPPAGVEHYYAPLAIIWVNDEGAMPVNHDCRRTFNSLVTLTEWSHQHDNNQ